ncbi:MAG: aminomethyl-transferring glycine dehydrogenase subunit GcvPA, partial [Akkermansiaceae bacterium]|nr:aminomethyl-transferring glycine dehydrogenase subunit GcvPA [Akkermansiaceae bacterium]
MVIPPGFPQRHIGPGPDDCAKMLAALDLGSLEDLVQAAVPDAIRTSKPLDLPEALGESAALEELQGIMGKNLVRKSFIGQGYHGTFTPPVIQRNILENPGWYTAYTPYQAEIAQGRLEALLNFQTMVAELTGMDVANASLLDEGTAAAEAMAMAQSANPKGKTFFVDARCHPQTIDVLRTRAVAVGIRLVCGDWAEFEAPDDRELIGALVQYPDTYGTVADYAEFAERVHAARGLLVVAADPLALTLLKEPGAFGADLCVGSTQRFGVPMGFGGPHAAYLACRDKLKRKLPGRLVGVSIDAAGKPAYRLALQTREQHIRRDKATSNICTAQVLLAVMASMYAVYHGPAGLGAIARRVHDLTARLAAGLRAGGLETANETYFDTLTVVAKGGADGLVAKALERGFNLRRIDDDRIGIALDETATDADVTALLDCLGGKPDGKPAPGLPDALVRRSGFLEDPVFNTHQSETEMLRYLRRLEVKDLALNESMIPLGSCTMKLNAAAEMMPLSWPEVSSIHPFVPAGQSE